MGVFRLFEQLNPGCFVQLLSEHEFHSINSHAQDTTPPHSNTYLTAML